MTQTAAANPAPYAGALISAESYVTEPADLWQQGLPPQWRAQGPRITRGPHGDQFEIAGVPARPLGLHGPLAQLRRIDVQHRRGL